MTTNILTTEQVTVIVTKSAGIDNAVVVFIDTTFEPDGSDGSTGLRILLNDQPVYVGKAYKLNSGG